MIAIDLVNVSNFILKNISLHIEPSSVHTVMGPNGAGKTTLLKVIAGLTKYTGKVLFNGTPVDTTPPWRREIGYLPQTNALFPHMTVLENVLFGLKNRGLSSSEAKHVAKYYLELLGAYELRDRYPLKLSWGEQRKVALARALAVRPKVLLLDEPFSGLHYDYRVQLVKLLEKILKEEKVTTVVVTHDLDEVTLISSTYTLLVDGKQLYSGELRGLLSAISQHLYYMNVYECTLEEVEKPGFALIKCGEIVLSVLLDPLYQEAVKGCTLAVTIPYNKVVLRALDGSPRGINSFRGRITCVKPLGNGLKLVKVNVENLVVNVLSSSAPATSEVTVEFPPGDLKVIPITR